MEVFEKPRSFEYMQRLSRLGFYLPARMTVLPLAGRRLALISPIPLDDALVAELAELGTVAYLIAPNLLHHLYLADALRRYPGARVLAPAALGAKRPELTLHGTLEAGLPDELQAAVELAHIEGAPKLDEFVFLHRASRALVVTDLVFNVVRPRGWFTKLVLFAMGTLGGLRQSRVWRVLAQDREALASSLERILDLPFETVLVAHGEPVTERARERLAQALRSYLPKERRSSAIGSSDVQSAHSTRALGAGE